MNHKRLLNALTKVGATISNPNPNRANYFKAVGKNGNVAVWYAQPMWNKPEELEAVSVHAPSPHTDIMTDCFCDYFFKSIKSVAADLKG
jgi:hypothetical protein